MIRQYQGLYVGPIGLLKGQTSLLQIEGVPSEAKKVKAQFDDPDLIYEDVRLGYLWHEFDRKDFQLITWCIKCGRRNIDPNRGKYCGDGSDKDNGHCYELVTYGIPGENMDVCVPKTWSDEQIVTTTNKRSPKGEITKWKIDEKSPRVTCTCQDMKERVHVTLK